MPKRIYAVEGAPTRPALGPQTTLLTLDPAVLDFADFFIFKYFIVLLVYVFYFYVILVFNWLL
jgi:hypothetical protein